MSRRQFDIVPPAATPRAEPEVIARAVPDPWHRLPPLPARQRGATKAGMENDRTPPLGELAGELIRENLFAFGLSCFTAGALATAALAKLLSLFL